MNSLPPHVKRRVEALQEIQKKRDEIEAQFKKERAELEARYEKLYSEIHQSRTSSTNIRIFEHSIFPHAAPLYSERAEVVIGTKEIPAKEGEPAGDGEASCWQLLISLHGSRPPFQFVHTESVKGIPEFWSTVLLKCDTTADMIKDKDLEVLNYLQDIKVLSRGMQFIFIFCVGDI